MLRALSLFSGCGGCSLGLQQASFTVQLAVDNNAAACASYAANFGGVRVWQTDLATLAPTALQQHAALGAGQLDLVVGGPPCQGFSSAGARDWHDPRNSLLRTFVDLLITLQPTWFVMENVEGLLTANDGFYVTEAILRLLEAGYWVKAKKVYMEQYGLPQRRKRLFIVGNRAGCAFVFPPPTHSPAQQLSLFGQAPQRSVLDAISDLPQPTADGQVQYTQAAHNPYQQGLRQAEGSEVQLHQSKPATALLQQRMEQLAQGATMQNLPPDLQHPSFQRRALRRVMDGTPSAQRGGAPSGLKRLRAAEPALTITASAPSEFVHPTANRFLTLRECARLQSFPDGFAFHGSFSAIATQIGNAVPPLFMRLLATQIAEYADQPALAQGPGRWLGIEATRSSGISPALGKMLATLEAKTYAFTR
ncbi:MAG: DNA cytosine methyltransferase [Chloroflexota bacterium]|nr:DNA cytosine methyltransferase [Chloroflexota bacterium]